ncbi:MAG: Eco57I restriction-modification methylase domain-containing protein [Candidatus Pacebacteria bacterium]|nr:Eco57I restriction-modification methylase domain-containing protein [Candidatus Paceibacterota bacterium]
MKTQNNYNPDVLSCLANLSNDEVFTSPKLANEILDLLPKEIWKDKNATFLDPVCKSGVFLREIAKRLLEGLKDEIPDIQKRINHIYSEQLFGIGITELTSLLSRRSLYCSKNANGKYSVSSSFENEQGNIFFQNIEHKWKNGRCEYCGASQTEYDREEGLETHAYQFIHNNLPDKIKNMKFDVIIGNPPYQLNDGGGTGASAIPLYHKFVEQAEKLNPRFLVMIIPSRWFAGGKGLDEFRQKMLNSKKISILVDYANSSDCFPGVTIAGGVCYFLREKECNDLCTVINKKNDLIISQKKRALNEYNIFVRNNSAIDIIRKIKEKNEKSLDCIVFSRNSFGLFSKEVGHNKYKQGDYVLYSLKGKSYIEDSKIVDRDCLVNKFKVIMTKAMSGGNKPSNDDNYLVISSTMRVLSPMEVCTETYLCIGSFDNFEEANNLKNYLATKFLRFLLLQALTSINISKEKFCFIPMQDFSKSWTDEKLYKKYKLTKEEIDFIESMIRPMQ